MQPAPIYLDNNATTAVDPVVLEQMLPYFSEHYGNAASKSHRFGWEAQEAVDRARAQVASLIGAQPKEIVFTSGATEANNLAVMGAVLGQKEKRHVVTTRVEHKAVLDPARQLERQGFEVSVVGVGPDGRAHPEAIEAALREDTGLCSVMLVNNEVGSVNAVAEIADRCKARGVLFHTDATQGVGKVPFDVSEMRVDLASLSAHKIYGPKGVGALYVRRRPKVKLQPLMHGGGHERGRRSGTLNVPAIVGFGAACARMQAAGDDEKRRIRALRDALWQRLREGLEAVDVNGDLAHAVAGTLNVSFAYVEAERLLLKVSDVLAASTGSACTSAALEPSHVLTALGVGRDRAHSAVRFSVGRFNSKEEIERAANAVITAVNELRAGSPLWQARQRGGGLGEQEG